MDRGSLPDQIGPRLRRLRTTTGRSLGSVAKEMGISSSALSQMETGVMKPSVNRLVEFVGVLGLPVSAIFDDHGFFVPTIDEDASAVAEPVPGVLVTHAADSEPAQLSQGVTYRRLSPAPLPGVDWFESTYPPGSSSSIDGAMLVHAGYESGYVIRGELTFEFSEGPVRLGAGSSLSFRATRPHRVLNDTDDVAVAAWLTLTDAPASGDAPSGDAPSGDAPST
ncbi:helix-turn-helix domain-containing protein [Isoptericola aurantiacus]|uniref:helix-turn-helix domain-containing protein n=1 Tax=Isoptericola aurantiacus TaxID=3377839 RepID=UPI00383BDC35